MGAPPERKVPTMATSRFLGEVTFTQLVNGAVFETLMDYESRELPVTIFLHHPDTFTDRYIELIDSALEVFASIDEMSRQAIATEITDETSQPWIVQDGYRDDINERWEGTDEEFVERLQVRSIEFHPDGGSDDVDRVITTYALHLTPLDPNIVVRLKQSLGPFVDPAE